MTVSPPQHLPNTPNIPSELPTSAENLGAVEMENLRDGDMEVAASGPANQAEHEATITAKISPTTAVSPLHHLPNTPSELPASAKNVGDVEMENLGDGDMEMVASGPANLAEHEAKIRAKISPSKKLLKKQSNCEII